MAFPRRKFLPMIAGAAAFPLLRRAARAPRVHPPKAPLLWPAQRIKLGNKRVQTSLMMSPG